MLRDAEGRDHLLSALKAVCGILRCFPCVKSGCRKGPGALHPSGPGTGTGYPDTVEVTRIADNGDITLKNGENIRWFSLGVRCRICIWITAMPVRTPGTGSQRGLCDSPGRCNRARQRLASLSDAYVALSRMKHMCRCIPMIPENGWHPWRPVKQGDSA